MFKNSATQVALKGLRHHRYDIYIYIHTHTQYTYRKKEMKIQERTAREKNYHMKFIFVCMVFMTNMSELEKHILLS